MLYSVAPRSTITITQSVGSTIKLIDSLSNLIYTEEIYFEEVVEYNSGGGKTYHEMKMFHLFH